MAKQIILTIEILTPENPVPIKKRFISTGLRVADSPIAEFCMID